MHGPVLPKNPHFADELIAQTLTRHGTAGRLEARDDTLAEKTAAVAMRRQREVTPLIVHHMPLRDASGISILNTAAFPYVYRLDREQADTRDGHLPVGKGTNTLVNAAGSALCRDTSGAMKG
jgi:hypothetical protein